MAADREAHGQKEEFSWAELEEQQRKLVEESAWILADGE